MNTMEILNLKAEKEKETTTVSGRHSQRKGREAERELAALLQSYGIPARPGAPVSYGTTPDVEGVTGIHPEVKRREVRK